MTIRLRNSCQLWLLAVVVSDPSNWPVAHQLGHEDLVEFVWIHQKLKLFAL